ncbi:Growth_factor receptor cysteine-rich domain superfamily [Hexamita inflata]|uniref:Growth factor receptor cysteine-rich domain superfamily n=1 Tax=Hexamita inflata TaxID=28002 RepID=A0AA86PQ56_9EUKA|nr:Growth factor receptor cysteine-rich domain superfamily [Hexamita inflata]
MYLYIQVTLNKCTTEECCYTQNYSEHFIQGECQPCQEIFDYDNNVCTTCKALYGKYSYFMNGNCNCGGGSVGKNTICEDCWAKSMIVIDNSCMSCSYFDKNAFYNFENICSCFKGLSFVNFRCRWYTSRQQRVIIISSVLTHTRILMVLVFDKIMTSRFPVLYSQSHFMYMPQSDIQTCRKRFRKVDFINFHLRVK